MELLKLLFLNIGKILDFFLNKKQKAIISDMEPVQVQDENLILIRYDKLENKMATGVLFFKNFEIAFKSGGWGKGSAPKGNYIAKNYRVVNGDAYALFGIGFFVDIIPQFETDRTELGIHFDGGNGQDGKAGFVGTLGCIGLQCSNLEDAIKVRNLFRDSFDTKKELECRII